MNRHRVFTTLLILVAGIILTTPVLVYGIPFFSDDAVTHHAVWYVHFSEQLWAGDLYPRWLMGMNNGLGSPVFFYYPPLLFCFTSLLRPFFQGDSHGWYQLGVSASAALVGSGLCAYLWLSQFVDRGSALAAAVLYMATPYHLASDLYIRGSLAEYWAFIWMPLILFFTHKIVKGDRLAVAGLAVSYALLVMTHLPTTLIFSPIPICYACWLATRGSKARTTGWVFCAMALGAGLSFVYLWPAMSTQHFVLLDRMTTGYFSYRNWLFFTNLSLWPNEKFVLLLTILDLAVIACGTFIINRANSKHGNARLNTFWYAVATVSILMMTQLSAPVWMVLSALRNIQFPWRFNSIVSLATTALLALFLPALKQRLPGRLKIARAIVLVAIIAWIPATGWAVWKALPLHHSDAEEINYKNKEIAQSREVPEYSPRWNMPMAEMDWETSIDEAKWDGELDSRYESLFQRVGQSEGTLSKVRIVEGTGQVNVSIWKPREIRVQTTTPAGMRLQVSQFYYPNWTAQLVGDPSRMNIQPSQPDGLITLPVPSGEHQVLLRLEQSSAERVGQIISLISVAITLAYLAAHKRLAKGRRKGPQNAQV